MERVGDGREEMKGEKNSIENWKILKYDSRTTRKGTEEIMWEKQTAF